MLLLLESWSNRIAVAREVDGFGSSVRAGYTSPEPFDQESVDAWDSAN